MTARPAVDVVVPFGGRVLEPVLARAARLARREGDTVTVVDNRAEAGAALPEAGGVRVVGARAVASSYFARNAGARNGRAPWILFVDADVAPPPDLLDRFFDPPPSPDAGLVAGEVEDEEPASDGAPAAVRYAWLTASMSQAANVEDGFAATANLLVRREAFEAVGGFREDVRSGGDADLCFRVRAAGWTLERREHAAVVHRSRRSLVRMLGQRAKHGSGAAWMDRTHAGAFPARSLPGVAWWAARRGAAGAVALARGDRDEALLGFLDGPAVLAFELGRWLPNDAQRR